MDWAVSGLGPGLPTLPTPLARAGGAPGCVGSLVRSPCRRPAFPQFPCSGLCSGVPCSVSGPSQTSSGSFPHCCRFCVHISVCVCVCDSTPQGSSNNPHGAEMFIAFQACSLLQAGLVEECQECRRRLSLAQELHCCLNVQLLKAHMPPSGELCCFRFRFGP